MASKINKFNSSKIRLALVAGLIFICGFFLSYLASDYFLAKFSQSKGEITQIAENSVNWQGPPAAVPGGVRGILMPHHLLVKMFMEKFYEQLAAANKYDRIVIISPNHFGYGFNYIETTEQEEEAPEFDSEFIEKITADKNVQKESRFFQYEHGVFVQYPFIKKYFPEAKIVPIIVKKETPKKNLDLLAAELVELDDGKTLYLGSFDFSHYTAEKWAEKNDLRILQWLNNFSKENFESAISVGESLDIESADSVAVDSAEGLYLMTEIMRRMDFKKFNLWTRTSSASMIKGIPSSENTSHIFGYFIP